MPFIDQTEIGEMQQGEYYLRQQSITQLIVQHDWIATMWLTWTGRAIQESERVILSGCLVACVDHGVLPPSAQATRKAASQGRPLAESVAAGLCLMGPQHGQAASLASCWLREAYHSSLSLEESIDQVLERGERLAGFGHRIYEIDPRTVSLSQLAKDVLPSTPYLDYALETARLLTKKKGTSLPLNVDGAIGALMLDLDAPSELADVIFLVARTVGLAAHAQEMASRIV